MAVWRINAIHASNYSCMKRVQVRLTRKLAEMIDGVDLSRRSVGDVFRLAEPEARLLVAEEWAVPTDKRAEREFMSSMPNLHAAESF
jgi:hypothetical protein